MPATTASAFGFVAADAAVGWRKLPFSLKDCGALGVHGVTLLPRELELTVKHSPGIGVGLRCAWRVKMPVEAERAVPFKQVLDAARVELADEAEEFRISLLP